MSYIINDNVMCMFVKVKLFIIFIQPGKAKIFFNTVACLSLSACGECLNELSNLVQFDLRIHVDLLFL